MKILFFFLCVFISSNSYSQQTFQLLDTFRFANDDSLNYLEIAVGPDKTAYLLSTAAFRVDKMDLAAKKMARQVGRHGLGPGEFGTRPFRLNIVDQNVVVSTQDRWVHVFDVNLNYVNRTFVKQAIFGIFSLGTGEYLAHLMSFETLDKYRSVYYIGRYRNAGSLFMGLEDAELFGPPNTIPNLDLSQYVIGVGPSLVAVAQEGSSTVRFFSHAGKQVREVEIATTARDMLYMEGSDTTPEVIKSMLRKVGIKDFRTALGGYVSRVRTSDSFTLIQGGLSSVHPMQSVTIVRHLDWKVKEDILPPFCSLFDVVGDRLYCLISDVSGPQAIQTFQIEIRD